LGNTTAVNGANNALTVLDAVGRRDIPVAVGSPEPLSQPLNPGPWLGLRTPALLHGPDGLWQIGQQHPHLPTDFDKRDVPTFYRDIANAHPGATLLALGPMTNIAQAFARYPDAMQRFGRIVIGAGAKNGGNRTPAAEYSLWQDPEAFSQVLSASHRPPIVMLPVDAFQQFSMSLDDVQDLCDRARDGLRLICPALAQFVSNQINPPVGRSRAWMPDVATIMYALDPSLGNTQTGLVKIITGNDGMRGHTEIALTLFERITMIGSDSELNQLTEVALLDPASLPSKIADLVAREPDNAGIVVDINERAMHGIFRWAVTQHAR
jgi:inosine-uridine nucleoside N-ribohydrolase